MAVKKAFTDLISLLEANKDVKVSKILDQAIEIASAKTNRAEGNTFLKDAAGNTVAIFDYYFKRWMPLVGDKAVEFGAKVKTATGFNSMCKQGVSEWTKQQRVAKNANSDLLTLVAKGEVKPQDIPAKQAEIEAARKAIVATDLGFAADDTKGLMKYLQKNGVTLAEGAEIPSTAQAA